MNNEMLMNGNTLLGTGLSNDVYLVKYLGGSSLLVWEEINSNELRLCRRDLSRYPVTVESLKEAGVWDSLTQVVQDQLNNIEIQVKEEIADRMDNVRKGKKRNPLFAKMPDKLKCECGQETAYAKGAYCEKADDRHMDVMDLIAEYKCMKCNGGRRGRVANPEWAHIPNIMNCCDCGKEAPVPKRLMVEKAKAAGVDVSELLKQYKCRACKKKLDK